MDREFRVWHHHSKGGIDMRDRICKLCLRPGNLQKSHLLPRALYRTSAGPGAGYRGVVLTTEKVALQTSRQVRDFVLCPECEQRMNKNGESYVMRLVDDGKGFPLLDRLKLAMPLLETQTLSVFSAKAVGIDTTKLGYFALSVLWKSSVHRWKIPGGTTSVSLGVYEEPVRKYLAGKTDFPSDVALLVIACNDFGSRGSSHLPAIMWSKGSRKMYSLLTRGIYFRVHVGSGITPAMRELCSVNSARKPILMRDCEDKMIDAYRPFFATAHIAKNLQAL